jgi:hypothetical protein
MGDRCVAFDITGGGESCCCAFDGSCLSAGGGVLGAAGVGAGEFCMTKLICWLFLFALLPPSIMLPRLEKDTWVGEVKSSKLPVGMTMSMPWKRDSSPPFASSE